MVSIVTTKIVDPRIQPPSEPNFSVNIGPQQNQVYTVNNSAISDSYVAFNNITTLGAYRCFLDTFELLIRAQITFNYESSPAGAAAGAWLLGDKADFSFVSFPFNKCCEEIRANINGGAFFSQPLTYLRSKERYWDDKLINASYGNMCPCNKPYVGSETCAPMPLSAANELIIRDHAPTMCSSKKNTFAIYPSGPTGSSNNDIIPVDSPEATLSAAGTTNPVANASKTFVVEWREPIFCSPFSSRYDETYGRPLYNITSIDLSFNLQDLRNMIRVTPNAHVTSYNISLQDVRLCYQVLTIPPEVVAPAATVIPYRRFVPYVTSAPSKIPTTANAGKNLSIESGVYTLNEVPVAVWIFVGPNKSVLQTNPKDKVITPDGTTFPTASWGHNKIACPIKNVSLTCANTTQIFNNWSVHDLYRMAKDNGCQDSFEQWSKAEAWAVANKGADADSTGNMSYPTVGSVLRCVFGKDIIIPDQQLVPGANANNMVFKATVQYDLPDYWRGEDDVYRTPALWLIFEYVGVASITPGQCNITMNPLGDGKGISDSEVINAADVIPLANNAVSNMEGGAGWWSKVTSFLSSPGAKRIFNTLKEFSKKNKLLSTAAANLSEKLPADYKKYGEMGADYLKSKGYGKKRMRGGAVMGMGDFM